MGLDFLCANDRSPCPVLRVIVSRLCPLRDYVCDPKDLPSGLPTKDNRDAMNSPDIITVYQVEFCSYEIIIMKSYILTQNRRVFSSMF